MRSSIRREVVPTPAFSVPAGNLYTMDDLSSETVFSYAVGSLGVQHIVVMGKPNALLNSLQADAHFPRPYQVRRCSSCNC